MRKPWAWNLLLEFYNDPDPGLRHEAFTAVVAKNKELPPLEAALLAQYADVPQTRGRGPHQEAHGACSGIAGQSVGRRRPGRAPGWPWRRWSATTRAARSPRRWPAPTPMCGSERHGRWHDTERRAALAPLLALATAPEPQERERQADWLSLAESALEGIAELGDTAALASLVPVLTKQTADSARLAARALAWVALPHHRETLRQAFSTATHK